MVRRGFHFGRYFLWEIELTMCHPVVAHRINFWFLLKKPSEIQ